jgi:hypothetical protein
MTTEFTTPHDVAAAVRHRCAASTDPVSVYWIAVSGSRTAFAAELNVHLREFPSAAIVVRGARFENPNSVFDDFATLVRDERKVLERELRAAEGKDACSIVLVARSELGVSQASSPVPLPEWFPVAGGMTVTSRIEDLSWTTEAPLSADVARIGSLSQLLFELDGVLLETLIARQSDRRAVQSLVDRIRLEGESLEQCIDRARLARQAVQNPSAYRPSLGNRESILARLWYLAQSEKPDGLLASIKALQRALDVPVDLDQSWHETLVAVLSRPTNRDPNQGARFIRNLLLTLTASAQFITAAAHADAYAAYPVPLLRATSHDLRSGLSDAVRVLRCL